MAWSDVLNVTEAFHVEHEKRFGYARRKHDIELVAMRVEAFGKSSHPLASESKANQRISSKHGNNGECSFVERSWLQPGEVIVGPTVILNDGSTLVVDSGWIAEVLSGGTLLLSRAQTLPSTSESSLPVEFRFTDFDPVVRDCLAQRLSGIATQMGVVLQQTAVSVNVKTATRFQLRDLRW